MRTHVSAERVIAAPAEAVYAFIADYATHHRPEGFLPPAFSGMQILSGGVGAGTVFRLDVTLRGRTRPMTAEVTEPEPGRVLVETSPGVVTRFTVDPAPGGCRVRFDSALDDGGFMGLMNRLFAARLLEPMYADELARLERYAQAHTAAVAA
jgi:Polyketide cyclase / dehydrase and lipid transport